MQRLQPAPATLARPSQPTGLTGELACHRLAEGGANAIPEETPQALFYLSQERRHLWSSRRGIWLIASSVIDLPLFATLATRGLLMAPLPWPIVAGLAAAAFLFAFVLDATKLILFKRFGVA